MESINKILRKKDTKLISFNIHCEDTNLEIHSNSKEAVDYFYEIIFPSGSNGLYLNRNENLKKNIKVSMYTLPERNIKELSLEIEQRGKFLGKCVQQRHGYCNKYAIENKVYYVYPFYDKSATPDIICKNNDEILLLSTEGPFDYKLLGRVIREIAFRKLEYSGYCCIHSSAVQLNNKGILIIGDSAAGKTTLALSLCKFFGAKYLTNDKILIKMNEEKDLVATPFSAAARLNYGTLKTLEVEKEFEQWKLKVKLPDEDSDWCQFNGVEKLNILPSELKRTLNLDVVPESKIDLIVYPKINRDIEQYILREGVNEEVLERNLCTPYDDQFPEDWLGIRDRSYDWLEENAKKVKNRIMGSETIEVDYSITDFRKVCNEISDLIKRMNS